jgi:ATP/ADP translocase/HEAT repeat protein
VITSYYVIKPVRNSLFIDRLGADNLPYVYIIAALFVGLVISFYSRFADRIGRQALVLGTFAFLASNLLIFWWVLRKEALLTSGAFYIWAKLYPLLLVSQFWLVANEFFTSPQAKRLFGLVGAGGIIGGIAGSAIAGGFAETLGSENLLLVSAAILAVCAALLIVIDRVVDPVRSRAATGDDESPRAGAWRLLRESAHLRTIAYILALTIIVSTIVDWQFNKATELFIPGEDEKTAYFGQFFTLLNVASVIIQLVLTSWVLRIFGVGVALLLLPLGLLTGSIGILIHPGLWTASFAKGAEGALRYSLDQSTRELLFLPLPAEVKYPGKPLVDMVVYRGGTGIAGLLVLAGTRLGGFGLQEFAVVAGVLVAFWMGITLTMRREFRESVKRLIRTRDVEPEELIIQHLDAATRDELRAALESDDEDAILYALALLEGVEEEAVVDRAERLLRHPSERVRARTLRALYAASDRGHLPDVEDLLNDPSMEVRVEAIHLVCGLGDVPASERIREFVESADPEVRAAALACVAQGRGPDAGEAGQLIGAMARRRDGDQAARERRLAAQAIATIEGRPELYLHLADLLHDPDPAVVRAAMEAAAQTRPPELVSHLTSHLCCSEWRARAREALAAYGPTIHDRLVQMIRDPRVPLEVRKAIPRIFYDGGLQEGVDRLVAVLPEVPPILRYHILKTLDRMRRNFEGLEFEAEPLERTLELDLRTGYQRAADRLALTEGTSPGLLPRLLKEREAEAFERVSRILALLYPLGDIFAAYQGLQSEEEATRSAGFELLDSSLSIPHRRKVGPLADPDISLEDRASRGGALSDDVVLDSRERTLDRLADDVDDIWLACLARAMLDREPPRRDDEERAPFHAHSLPRARRSFESLLTESRSTMLKLVERADFLSDADIFSDLKTEDLAKIAAITDEREYEEGEVLFSQRDAGSEMFMIVSGRVRATRDSEEAFVADRGESVGTLALIDARPREFTAVAVRPTRALVIDRSDFMDLLRDNFDLVEGLLVHLSRIVRKLNEQVGPESGGLPSSTQ